MNTKRGKGYFYSLGARDANYWTVPYIYQAWPEWAKNSYRCGFFGTCL